MESRQAVLMIHTLFFFIPFFMLGGTAWQGGSLYLCAMFVPTFLMLRGKSAPDFHRWRIPLLMIGGSFFTMFLIFPFANFINFLTEPGHAVRMFVPEGSPPFRKLLTSQMSTGFLMSGIFLCVFALFLSGKNQNKLSRMVNADLLLKRFHQGMLFASLILLSYGVFQHFTGIDLMSSTGRLSETRFLASSGRYRTSGFFGHPLSLAGASLGIYVFYLILCRGRLSLFNQGARLARRASAKKNEVSVVTLLMISLSHLALIVLSGGRFASMVAVFLTIVFLFMEISTGRVAFKNIFAGLVLVLSGMVIASQSGLLDRYPEIWSQIKSGGPERFKFWEVYWAMIEDKPWFGHGYAWMKFWSRDVYYSVMGYEQLAHKYNAHNIYLETLSNVGLFGSMILLFSLIFSGIAFRYLISFGGFKLAGTAFFISVFANMINGITQNTFFDSNVVFIYLFLYWTFLWLSVLNSGGSVKRPALTKNSAVE